MIAQRVSTLATLLLLPVALPAGLSASVVGHSLTAAVYALPGRSAEPTVQVTNDNRETANVILVGGQGWYVLGLVHSRETRVFAVPRDLVGMQDVQVLANTIVALTGFESKPITLRPSGEVNLVITSPATHSLLNVG